MSVSLSIQNRMIRDFPPIDRPILRLDKRRNRARNCPRAKALARLIQMDALY